MYIIRLPDVFNNTQPPRLFPFANKVTSIRYNSARFTVVVGRWLYFKGRLKLNRFENRIPPAKNPRFSRGEDDGVASRNHNEIPLLPNFVVINHNKARICFAEL
jgi:hypothetical protein